MRTKFCSGVFRFLPKPKRPGCGCAPRGVVHARLESLVEVVTSLIDHLEASNIPYAFGGAIALSAWSEPRATTDVDLNLWVIDDELPTAVALLQKAGVSIELDDALRGSRERGMFAAPHGSYRVDVFVPSVPFYDEALTRRLRVTLADRQTWVLSPESLAVFKMLFFRPKDLVDLARLLEVRQPPVDAGFVRGWLVDMVGPEDARIAKWDELTHDTPRPISARPSSSRPRRKPGKRS
jgi:hypothetical protein